MPKLTVNLNEKDYNDFFNNYKCRHDTSVRYLVDNEACYSAPWINYDKILEGALKKKLISKSDMKENELELINRGNITLTEFEQIFATQTNYTIKDILSSKYGLYSIPEYEAENASLTLDIDG